jgi:hypothetical protein
MYGNANGNEPLFSSLTPTNYTYANNVINDNPDFTTPGSDFTLQSVSPAIDAGLDLGLTTDYRNYVVPANSTPDIGAYEYGSSPAEDPKPILQEIEIGNIATNFIVLTYDINLDESSTPITSDFSLTGTVRYISNIMVSGKTVILHLNLPASYGNVIYLTYTGTAIKSTGGISADTFESQLVTNNILSNLRAITSFSFLQQVSPAVINNSLYTVAIEVSEEANITALTPTITVSDGATINPLSGVQRDFTNPVTYTVTAADWSTRNWTVTVTGGFTPATGGFVKSGNKFIKYNGKIVKQ